MYSEYACTIRASEAELYEGNVQYLCWKMCINAYVRMFIMCKCVCECLSSQGREMRHAGSTRPWTVCHRCLKIPQQSQKQNEKWGAISQCCDFKCAQQSVECYLWGKATGNKSNAAAEPTIDGIIFSFYFIKDT